VIKVNLLAEARAKTARKVAGPRAPGKSNNLLFFAVIVVGLLYVLGMWWHLHSVKSELDEKIRVAQAEVDRLKSIIDEVNGYEKEKARLEAKINLINDLKRNQKGPVRLMDEMSKALPDLVWLTEMDLSGNTISVAGHSMTPNAVANFIENLKKSTYFAEPAFDTLRQEGGVYFFNLSVTFTYGEPVPAASGPAPAAPAKTGA
jgi:Tfp pilus assembly protein PilN